MSQYPQKEENKNAPSSPHPVNQKDFFSDSPATEVLRRFAGRSSSFLTNYYWPSILVNYFIKEVPMGATAPRVPLATRPSRRTMAASKLFQPIQVGTVTLQHRVVMAPMTRFRGNSKHTHTDLAVEHYAARASVPGTLIISEATLIAHKASGESYHIPGIWSDEQVAAWKKVCVLPGLLLLRAVLNASDT